MVITLELWGEMGCSFCKILTGEICLQSSKCTQIAASTHTFVVAEEIRTTSQKRLLESWNEHLDKSPFGLLQVNCSLLISFSYHLRMSQFYEFQYNKSK